MAMPHEPSSGAPAPEGARFSLKRLLMRSTPDGRTDAPYDIVPFLQENMAARPAVIVLPPPAPLAPATPEPPTKKTKSGSQTRQRTKGIYVACTPDEYTAMQDRAERSGLSTSAYLRTCGLGDAGPRAQRRPPVERQLLAQLLGQLGKIGGNIHQITKRLNFGEGVNRAEVDAALTAFRAAAAVIMQALGKRPHDH